MKIGFVGLGNMGTGMANNILNKIENKSDLFRSGSNFMKIGFTKFASTDANFTLFIICFKNEVFCKSLSPKVLGELTFIVK